MPVELSTGSPDGAIELSNRGDVDLTWNVSGATMAFGTNQRDFYTAAFLGGPYGTEAPDFTWFNPGADSELTEFRLGLLDDGGVLYTLPFDFPLFGSAYSTVFISANGVLVFGTSDTGSGDATGDLPSTAYPNGVVAPFWEDLLCTASTRVSVESPREGTLVVQFEGMTVKSTRGVAHFEVRLFADGQITVNIRNFGSSWPASVKVGVETADGTDGINVAPALPATAPFAISFTPLIVPLQGADGQLGAGSAGTFPFEVTSTGSSVAYLGIQAFDQCGGWTATRDVRVVKTVFSYRWLAGSWGPCLASSCEDESGTRTRDVICVGSDNSTYSGSSCASAPSCTPFADWEDDYGYTCNDYVYNAWCTSSGGFGSGWPSSWTSFAARSYSGRGTAAEACCSCGGGASNERPPDTETCTDPINGCTGTTTATSTTTKEARCLQIMTVRAQNIKATLCD
jgi:hypothetical protein